MNLALIIPNIVLLTFICNNPITTSANFYPTASSVPPSSIPKQVLWDNFTNLTGCHKGVKADGLQNLKKYFQHFGYLDSSYDDFSDQFDGNFEYAVRRYQENFRINMTGELDNSTLNHIIQPRCGNPDIVNGTSTMFLKSTPSSSSTHAVAHYSFFPNRPRWRGRTDLTYAFQPENQLNDVVRNVFGRAFQRWAEVVPITFSVTSSFSEADIRIGFFTRDHGDGEPFDGVLGTLAHAFSPPNGRFHLDAEENWVIDGSFANAPYSAMDLESVAVHEIGHLLGLGHSSVEAAIMYPTISSGIRKVELDPDDIAGVQELYGANPNFGGAAPGVTPRGMIDTSRAAVVGLPMFGMEALLVLVSFVLVVL